MPTPVKLTSLYVRAAMLWCGCLPMTLLVANFTCATEKRTQVQVSAQVVPWARLECTSQPDTLHISREDVSAGFKEVVLRCTVVTNDRRGAFLKLVPRAGLTTSMIIRGMKRDLILFAEPAEIWQAAGTQLDLVVRFNLRPDLRPGVYPVPLWVAATPRHTAPP